MMKEILAAAAGTFAFSVLFGVPRKYYPFCGIIGASGWIVYMFTEDFGVTVGAFVATVAVVLLSRVTAVREKCPVTVFLISGIFPLVPGSYVYWTAYYFVTDQLRLAVHNGYMAVKIAFAIVLGIIFVFEIPQKVFLFLIPQKKENFS